jgi:O-antigen/teichoic acid export membrane protein
MKESPKLTRVSYVVQTILSFFKNKSLLLIDYCWRIIFHRNAPHKVLKKIKRFGIFAIGMMLARFISVVGQIVAGRQLGPEVYGQLTIILLLASYFTMPMVTGWGLVFTKIAARETDPTKIKRALKSLLAVVFVCSGLTVVFLMALQQPLTRWLDISPQLMRLTIIMTMLYGWWILSKQLAQGLQHWHTYVIIENIWAIIILTGISSLSLCSKLTLVTVSLMFFAGYFLAGLVISKIIWQSVLVKIDWHYVQDILTHGFFLLLNGLVGVATFSIDRILINTNLGAEEVGIYQAHFLSTYGIMSAFMTIILTYIFPTFCKDKNNNIRPAMDRISTLQYPLTIIISIITGGVMLWMYSYPISLPLFVSLCLFNAVQFHVQLKIWYFTSKGTKATRITIQSQIIFLIANIILLLLLIRHIGIIAGGISLLLAACLSLAFLIQSEKLFYNEKT